MVLYGAADPPEGYVKPKDVLDELGYLPRAKKIATYALIGGMPVMTVFLCIITWKRSAWVSSVIGVVYYLTEPKGGAEEVFQMIPHRTYKRPATHMGYVEGTPQYKAVKGNE